MNKANVKLSHAMREGAKLRPQNFDGSYFDTNYKRSCALGASLEYVYGIDTLTNVGVFSVFRYFNIPIHTTVHHPARNDTEQLSSIISTLNDDYR